MNEYNISKRLRVAKTPRELKKIWSFRQKEYSKILPNITGFDNDPYDECASVLFTADSSGEITSTGRLVFDSVLGLPEESLVNSLIQNHRHVGLKLAEYGRVIIRDSNSGLIKDYFKSVYQIAIDNNIDSIIVVSKKRDLIFYKKMIGAKLLSDDVGETFGGKDPYTCIEWIISKTNPRFFKWCRLNDQ